jgi:hypothetical protein
MEDAPMEGQNETRSSEVLWALVALAGMALLIWITP